MFRSSPSSLKNTFAASAVSFSLYPSLFAHQQREVPQPWNSPNPSLSVSLNGDAFSGCNTTVVSAEAILSAVTFAACTGIFAAGKDVTVTTAAVKAARYLLKFFIPFLPPLFLDIRIIAQKDSLLQYFLCRFGYLFFKVFYILSHILFIFDYYL